MTAAGQPARGRPRRIAPLVAVALLAPALATAARPRAAAPAGPGAARLAEGERIYRDGILPSGRPLEGIAQAGVERTGEDASCASCHRRSGYGASEGPIRIPPITAPALWGRAAPPMAPPAAAPPGRGPASPVVAAAAARLAARRARIAAQLGSDRRPAYDDVSLARAIREGVDATGRPLSPGMPRFALGDGEMEALVAYLRTLSTGSSPGVTGDELHLATVVQPGVDPGRRRAMLEVLQAFVHDKNAGTRREVRRREGGTERMYRAYRRWVLHVWDLTGPAAGWGRQLEALYGRQPVFALVGGMGNASWRPIHAFSERRGLPCLFPQVELPASPEAGFYTVYLSRGIALEAEALAKHLAAAGGAGGPVTQVFRREETSAAAAAAFREAMGGAAVEDLAPEGTLGRGWWERLARERPGATVVLWLPAADVAEAGALVEEGSPVRAVYLSSTLLAGDASGLAAGAGGRVRLVHPLDLPGSRGARLLRVKRWLHEKGIALTDEKVQMNAYFAVAVTADAVAHLADLFSREYLVERIEHLVGNTVTPSVYPRVSLGPGQRFASKGSFIVELRAGEELAPVSSWITP
jgi:hypothetical protein